MGMLAWHPTEEHWTAKPRCHAWRNLQETFPAASSFLIPRGQRHSKSSGFLILSLLLTKTPNKNQFKEKGFYFDVWFGVQSQPKDNKLKVKKYSLSQFQITLIVVYCYRFPTLFLIIVSFWGEWGSNCVAQTGLKCAILLPQLSQHWD